MLLVSACLYFCLIFSFIFVVVLDGMNRLAEMGRHVN